MTRRKEEKTKEFIRLCSVLTRQGFQFVKQKGVWCALTFPKPEVKRLYHPDTRLPFVRGLVRISGDTKKECFQFDQRAGR